MVTALATGLGSRVTRLLVQGLAFRVLHLGVLGSWVSALGLEKKSRPAGCALDERHRLAIPGCEFELLGQNPNMSGSLLKNLFSEALTVEALGL